MTTALALPEVEGKTPLELRGLIVGLEQKLLELPAEQKIEIKVTHHFAPGVYMREVFVPKGTVVTGKIHKTEHLNIISQGDITVYTEEGMKRLKAPFTLLSKPGTKRVGFAHEDTIWTTIHPTNETDVDVIESQIIAKSFEELEHKENLKLEEK